MNESREQVQTGSQCGTTVSPNSRQGLRDTVFLTWERHRRTLGIAEHYDIPVEEIIGEGSRWRRYPRQIWRTIAVLVRSPATTWLVQNPSLILSLVTVIWRRLFAPNRHLVVDAHNQAVTPYLSNNRFVRALSRFVLREADLTLVTNRFLAAVVERYGGRALVLPDRLPTVSPHPAIPLETEKPMSVMVIATFAPDEPIEAIIHAAQYARSSVRLAFTGNFHKLSTSLSAKAGRNVQFLGFLEETAYWQAMAEAHAVLDLTMMPNCLVCGAYEAIALGRPVILSDTAAQREYFRRAGRYTKHTPEAIAEAFEALRQDYASAVEDVTQLRAELIREWGVLAANAAERINALG